VTAVGTFDSLVRITDMHLVQGKLNLLDVDRLLDIGFSDPDFSTRKLTRGSITWPLRPNTTRPATWRVTPIRATPSALATILYSKPTVRKSGIYMTATRIEPVIFGI
jgi:hypothetical protein